MADYSHCVSVVLGQLRGHVIPRAPAPGDAKEGRARRARPVEWSALGSRLEPLILAFGVNVENARQEPRNLLREGDTRNQR